MCFAVYYRQQSNALSIKSTTHLILAACEYEDCGATQKYVECAWAWHGAYDDKLALTAEGRRPETNEIILLCLFVFVLRERHLVREGLASGWLIDRQVHSAHRGL